MTETLDLKLQNSQRKAQGEIFIGLGNDFLDMTWKEQATKAKIDKWYYFKLKSICTVPSPPTAAGNNRVKRQPT